MTIPTTVHMEKNSPKIWVSGYFGLPYDAFSKPRTEKSDLQSEEEIQKQSQFMKGVRTIVSPKEAEEFFEKTSNLFIFNLDHKESYDRLRDTYNIYFGFKTIAEKTYKYQFLDKNNELQTGEYRFFTFEKDGKKIDVIKSVSIEDSAEYFNSLVGLYESVKKNFPNNDKNILCSCELGMSRSVTASLLYTLDSILRDVEENNAVFNRQQLNQVIESVINARFLKLEGKRPIGVYGDKINADFGGIVNPLSMVRSVLERQKPNNPEHAALLKDPETQKELQVCDDMSKFFKNKIDDILEKSKMNLMNKTSNPHTMHTNAGLNLVDWKQNPHEALLSSKHPNTDQKKKDQKNKDQTNKGLSQY